MIDPDKIFLGAVDASRVLEQFPALAFFDEACQLSIGRMVMWLLQGGATPEELQRWVDSDYFIITLAGSVFAQVSGIPNFGCDGGVTRYAEQ